MGEATTGSVFDAYTNALQHIADLERQLCEEREAGRVLGERVVAEWRSRNYAAALQGEGEIRLRMPDNPIAAAHIDAARKGKV